ncbi:coiled-coil domain-containing protein [Natronoglycomyces albus]|uniref:ARB-07466-like C-terminal domain-containing protein n=1 Tax=Natronoglycomyces albus TaxID=2811108 RepID=A0A895XWB6_9ACTN|nr:hypothetical protein [Natronoglycomyces albus]QSB06816.1 hypothetical protein JQS30_07990 [Natronoglycomyces albus]
MHTQHHSPLLRHLIAIGTAVIALLFLLAPPASADPDEHALEEDLAEALEAVVEAEDTLTATEKRAEDIEESLAQAEAQAEALTDDLNDYAVYLHQQGDLASTSALLSAPSPDVAIDSLTYLTFLAEERAALVADVEETAQRLRDEQAALEDELEAAAEALEEAQAARDDLEAKLDELRMQSQGGPSGDGGAGAPAPVERNSDGSLPSESCSVNDPTTSGCLTPRTLHVLNETQSAGFNHYVSCYRSGGGGEHPQGRACDFSAAPDGFRNEAAQGAHKTYGDNLAAWYVNHADALGVYYVIWYHQIWFPGRGWSAYSSGNGTPNGDHTNHVHVSVR